MPVLKPYADAPVRRARQIVADVLVGAVGARVGAVAFAVHDAVSRRWPCLGQRLEPPATTSPPGSARPAASPGGVPLVGDALSAPFDGPRPGSVGVSPVAGTRTSRPAVATPRRPGSLAVPLVRRLGAGGAALAAAAGALAYRRRSSGQRFVDSDAGGWRLLALRALSDRLGAPGWLRVDAHDPLGRAGGATTRWWSARLGPAASSSQFGLRDPSAGARLTRPRTGAGSAAAQPSGRAGQGASGGRSVVQPGPGPRRRRASRPPRRVVHLAGQHASTASSSGPSRPVMSASSCARSCRSVRHRRRPRAR